LIDKVALEPGTWRARVEADGKVALDVGFVGRRSRQSSVRATQELEFEMKPSARTLRIQLELASGSRAHVRKVILERR
jgi:hypothetical protein